ncbi:alpha/beta fold hydrolase [Flavobacterium sp. H122]|uniref:alpha/beta fold hydrolase n=1 Tax=Flavobacterium sp. H122 TaxID=2529860 RepID=UPI0010AAC98F|nr:alpha/beta fold hydrolase [Flavobacterium sp. H122]
MKLNPIFSLLFLLFFNTFFSQVKLEKVATYFPELEELKNENINYYRFTVPENWEKTTSTKNALAIAVVKSKNTSKKDPVVFIQGGPGASTLDGISFWVNHKLRSNHDIILIDLRGTGFSEPKLCPDLGEKFFQILAKNQSKEKDVLDKINVSLECKQEMIDKGVDINSYNSISVARDLHALKNALKINKWNVYGVSFGTFISQTYAKMYPKEIGSLILDSSIPDIADYYVNNTKNYKQSLDKLFKDCRENPNCNKEFPDLEKVYYQNIVELEKKPITVNVDKSIIPAGKFTYNVEDYKIAIQQSLYNRKLAEILPVLIYQFKDRNASSLAGLVQAFSGALSLNYGNYFCFTCNDVIPFNNLKKYDSIASSYPKLKGGLSFYRSDFEVCNKWKTNQIVGKSTSLKNNENFKVLILSGGFDPITSLNFAEKTALNFNKNNVQLVKGYAYGHTLGYTKTGAAIINDFVENTIIKDSLKNEFDQRNVNFRTGIYINKGVVKMSSELNAKKWYYFLPLIISLMIILGVFMGSLVRFVIKKKPSLTTLSLFITSFLILAFIVSLVLGFNSVMSDNLFILAFGIPSRWDYVFLLYKLVIVCSVFTALVLLMKQGKENLPLVTTLILAYGIYHYYFLSWFYF